MSFRPKRVSARHAALNPIAQAVARAELSKTIRNAQIAMLLANDLEAKREEVVGISRYLTLAIRAAEIDGVYAAERRELESVLDALREISADGFRVPRNEVVDICDAIDLAFEIIPQVSKASVRRADLDLLATEGVPHAI